MLIGTSWKMNKTIADARTWAMTLAAGLRNADFSGLTPFVIPPVTALHAVREELTDSPVVLGVQNAHWEDCGAFTGEISPLQAADAGASIVEIGHSERRALGETDEQIRLKTAAALRHRLIPLVCIGEDSAAQRSGRSGVVITDQAESALAGLSPKQQSRVVIAYEPIWAIGEQGREPSVDELTDQISELRSAIGERVRAVIYGGSVNTSNARDLLGIPGIDGLFIGRSALDASAFLEVLAISQESVGRRRTPTLDPTDVPMPSPGANDPATPSLSLEQGCQR